MIHLIFYNGVTVSDKHIQEMRQMYREIQMQHVVHWKKSPYDVYIGRPSKWGNPYSIGKDGSRTEVIEKYRKYLLHSPKLLQDLHELRGKVLGCWCFPKSCHGDVLAELANKTR